ncbi:hypothetical protein K7432_009305 [Basidiobolus ranarum]|uniref:Uncharacterized protein n=1 Tax=Basidiobolus ranarum TaxID=34480 RepID=A0ABR2WQI2_9FUNG
MIPANNLLLLLSSALLASSFVVERGYVPPAGISYCQDLLSHLNTRHGLNIDPGMCSGRPDKSDDGLELLNPADLSCDELAVRVRALGIHIDANVCLGNIVNGSHRNIKRGEDDNEYERQCRDIVARLRLLKINTNTDGVKVDANVCVGLRGTGELSRNEINRMGCETLVARAKVLGILDVDVDVCLQNVREPRKLRRSGDDEYNECKDIVARLRLLGIQVDANVCLGVKGSDGWSKDYIDRLGCSDIVAHAKVLGILKADVNVCLGNIFNLGHTSDEYNECSEIAARLRLLGLKVDANVCLGTRGSKGWSKDHIAKLKCEDIVAHAKVLGILKADVNICLGNISNLGHTRGSNNEEYSECSDIIARLRLLGLKVDANVCIGIRGSKGWSKDHVDRLRCEDIVAHAKVLGIIKADVNVCLGNILNLGHSRKSNSDEYNECPDIAARLRILGLKLDADVCIGVKSAGGWTKDDVHRKGCEDIQAHAKVLNIIKADVNVCIRDILAPSKSRRAVADAEYNECNDIVVRLRLLGIKLNADVCIGVRRAGGWSKEDTEHRKCHDIVAHAKVLRILEADVDVCLANEANNRKSEHTDYNECEDIAVRLRLLGININVNVCVGVKSHSGWSKDDVEQKSCDEIVAHAKVLRILEANVNVC